MYSLAIAMALNQAGAARHEKSPESLSHPLSISSATWGQRLERTLKLYTASRNMDQLPNFFIKELQHIKETGALPKPAGDVSQFKEKQWRRREQRYNEEQAQVAQSEAPQDEPNLKPIEQEQ